jgi:type IV pilus assembly protein PilE
LTKFLRSVLLDTELIIERHMKRLTLKDLSKGFTLIELLVVIAILGVLAAALIAAIDPIEQIKKSQDSSKQSIATEFNQAVQRYYAQHSVMPWDPNAVNPATGATAACAAAPAAGSLLNSAGMTACRDYLINDGELKAAFTTVPTTVTSVITVSGDVAGNSAVCFVPSSRAIKTNSNTIYTSIGGPQAGCTATSVNCYWCSK